MSCTRNTSVYVYLMNLFEVGYMISTGNMLGLFCRGILLDIQLYDFVVCLFEQNNIWGNLNWSIIKFQQGKGITTITTKKSHQWNACVCSALVVEMGRLWFLLK